MGNMRLPREWACAGDDDLLTWTKQDAPIIEHPPQGLALTGFRDPYIIEQGGKGRPWKIAIGSGIKGQGGTILQYTSDELLQGTGLLTTPPTMTAADIHEGMLCE